MRSGKSADILRSSSIIGAASLANIVIGLLRTKVAALLLGPAGIGLVGLLQSLVSTGSAVAGLGVASSGVRQIAQAVGARNAETLHANRRALSYLSVVLALVGGFAVWLLRRPLAAHVLSEPSASRAVGWLGVAVAFTVLSNSQVALLNGLRRIGDMARVTVFGASLGTLLGIAALTVWGSHGIVPYVISAPLGTLIAGAYIVRRMRSAAPVRVPLTEIGGRAVPMVRFGFSLMIANVSATVAFLAVRAIVNQRLGAVALGQFSAAWMISMTYIGFVLQAMGTDYYPRLTAAIHDSTLVNRMVNEQSDIALLLAAPVLIGMQAAAPWVIQILYSSKFDAAVAVLRWQIAGDVLKIMSWSLAYVVLASGKGRVFIITETFGVVVYAGFVWLAIGRFGLTSTGIGFLVMYVIYLPVVYLLARRMTAFRFSPRIAWTGIVVFSAVAGAGFVGEISDRLGLACGLPLAIAAAIYTLVRLSALGALPARLGIVKRFAVFCEKRLSRTAVRKTGS